MFKIFRWALVACLPALAGAAGARAANAGLDLSSAAAGAGGESSGAPGNEAAAAGPRSDIVSRVFIPARPDSVWLILTDYDHLREFIPNLVQSRLLEDHGRIKLIEQVGSGRWFFVGKKARVVLEVEERKFSRLDFHVVDGDFSLFDGSWELTPRLGGRATLLTYRLTARARFLAPSFVLKRVLRRDIPARLLAVRDRAVSLGQASLAGAGAPAAGAGAAK